MNFKRIIGIAALLASGITLSHAAEQAPAEKVAPPQRLVDAGPTSIPTRDAGVARAVGKSREQVVAELILAKQDGSYIEPSELYPEPLVPRTTRSTR